MAQITPATRAHHAHTVQTMNSTLQSHATAPALRPERDSLISALTPSGSSSHSLGQHLMLSNPYLSEEVFSALRRILPSRVGILSPGTSGILRSSESSLTYSSRNRGEILPPSTCAANT